MASLTDLGAVRIRDGVAKGEFTARQVAEAHLARIAKHDGAVHAFLHVMEVEALQAADVVDAARKAGRPLGALAGVPVALKDNLCVTGVPATCASRILEGWKPPYTATAVERLLAAGAVPIGKTNLDEFAMGSSTENSAYGPTRNPWDLSRTPGGSSGGSAAAVAAGFAPIGLGSDTGGSIRQPAACCGVVGVKPTYGAVSRYGLIAFASSLDQIGPFGRTVEDAYAVLKVISGERDPKDQTSMPVFWPEFKGMGQDMTGLRVGLPRQYFADGLDPECRAGVDRAKEVLKGLGATFVEVDLPSVRYGIPTYYVVATVEAASNLARYDGTHFGARPAGEGEMAARTRGRGFGTEVKRRILLGTFASSSGYSEAYYVQALKVRRRIRDEFDKAFQACDVLLGPTVPAPAFKLGEKSADPIQMYLSDIFTVGLNLAGLPGIALPCGRTRGGLPLSVQIAGPAQQGGEQHRIFAVAAALETALGFPAAPAPLGGEAA